MRLIGFFLAGLMFAALCVQTLTLRKAALRLETVEKKVAALAEEQRSTDFHDPHSEREALDVPPDRDAVPASLGLEASLGALGAAAAQAGGLKGIAAANDDPLPLPAEFSNQQDREQLATFVRAQIEKERQTQQQQRIEDTLQRQNQSNVELAQRLGLDGNTSAQFLSVLSQTQQQRRDLMAQVADGTLPRMEVREKMREASQRADEQIKSLLGEEKFKQYEETRRQDNPRGGRRSER